MQHLAAVSLQYRARGSSPYAAGRSGAAGRTRWEAWRRSHAGEDHTTGKAGDESDAEQSSPSTQSRAKRRDRSVADSLPVSSKAVTPSQNGTPLARRLCDSLACNSMQPPQHPSIDMPQHLKQPLKTLPLRAEKLRAGSRGPALLLNVAGQGLMPSRASNRIRPNSWR